MPRRAWASVGLVLSLIVTLNERMLLAEEAKSDSTEKITFDDHIQPIFRQKCASCHNPDKKSSGLDLTSYTALMEGGSSGDAVDPGSPDGSYLYLLVTHDSQPYMPPESDRLPDENLDLIGRWIEQGALENSGSKPLAQKKPRMSLELTESPTERPAKIPLPGRLEKDPLVTPPVPGVITAVATSPWAPLAAVASQRQVLLYHTETLDLLGVLPFPEGIPYSLRFSRNGSLLLAGGGHAGASGRVVVWSVATGERLFEVGDELDAVLAADINADQTLIALGGPQKVVRVYAISDGSLQFELRKHTDWIHSLEFSPDGVLLATGDRAGNLMVWEGYTGREYLTLKGHTAAITAVSWRADSNLLASASEDGSVRVWGLENGNQIKNWNAHGGGVTALEFTRDGRLVTSGRDRVSKLWGTDWNQQQQFGGFSDITVQVSFCDETDRVAVADWTGAIRVFKAGEDAPIGELRANPPSLVSRLADAEARLSEVQDRRRPFEENLSAAQKQLEQARAALLTAEQRLAAATEELEPVQAEYSATEAEVGKWKAELEFIAQVNQLREKRDAVEQQVASLESREMEIAEQWASLRKSLQDANDANARMADAEKEMESQFVATQDSLRQAMVRHQEQVEATKLARVRADNLKMATQTLAMAVEKAEAAAQQAADEELQTAAKQLQDVLGQKRVELEKYELAAKESVVRLEEAVQNQRGGEEQLEVARKRLETARKQRAEAFVVLERLTAEMAEVEKLLAETKSALATHQERLNTLQEQFVSLRSSDG